MRKFLVFMLVLALSLVGCSNKCDFKKQQTPALYEASFVESSGTGEMMIKVTGIGCSVEEALEEAKKTAVWFVLEGGDKPILKTQAEKTRAYGLELQMYADPVKYIRWAYPSGLLYYNFAAAFLEYLSITYGYDKVTSLYSDFSKYNK